MFPELRVDREASLPYWATPIFCSVYGQLVPILTELLTDPNRMRSSLHCDPSSISIAEVLPQSSLCRSEPALFGDLAGFVQNTVVTPQVTNVDADCLCTSECFLLSR